METQQDKKRILVVDDDPFIQIALRNTLETDFLLEVANDGQEALDLNPTQFDFIVMDINMPRMNGIDATCAIRLQEKGEKHVPIIGITANVIEDVKEDCLNAGMDAVFHKPILLEDVKSLITQYTE